MFNPFRRLLRPKPRVLIFTCPTCGNSFANHRKHCRYIPGLGGDRYYCKCPVCGVECKVGAKEEKK